MSGRMCDTHRNRNYCGQPATTVRAYRCPHGAGHVVEYDGRSGLAFCAMHDAMIAERTFQCVEHSRPVELLEAVTLRAGVANGETNQ